MPTISPNQPASLALIANKVTLIDLRSWEFDIPHRCQLAFKSTHKLWFRLDNEHVALHRGFALRPNERNAFSDGWFQNHVMYVVSETDNELIFEVIVNWELMED